MTAPALAQFKSAVEAHRECDPSYTLEAHIASLRDGDPKRWAELNAEWNSNPQLVEARHG